MSAVLTQPVYHEELIDGEKVQKALPKRPHIRLQKYLTSFLDKQLPEFLEALPELNVIVESDRLIPDITVAYRKARYIEDDLADAPLLAIEILSPGQTLSGMMNKCERLLNAGVPSCWIFWPEREKAWEYTGRDLVEITPDYKLTLEDEAGIIAILALNLDDMWRAVNGRLSWE